MPRSTTRAARSLRFVQGVGFHVRRLIIVIPNELRDLQFALSDPTLQASPKPLPRMAKTPASFPPYINYRGGEPRRTRRRSSL